MISDHSRFVLKKQWDCVVTSIESDGTINATARDPENPEEEALELEFSLDEVVEKDMGLVRSGAKFYWTLGKRHYPDGRVESVNFLSWRRSAETSQGAKFDAYRRSREEKTDGNSDFIHGGVRSQGPVVAIGRVAKGVVWVSPPQRRL